MAQRGKIFADRAEFDLLVKNNYTTRVVSIPHVEDLVVAQAILNLIGPMLDKKISSRSYAYRIDSNDKKFIVMRYSEYHTFRKVIEKNITPQLPMVVVSDIVGFYDYIELDVLRQQLLAMGVKEELTDVIDLQLRAWQWRPDYKAYRSVGLPQGGNPITSFYANLYLEPVDRFLESQHMIIHERWVDDLSIHVHSELEARHITRDLDEILRKLGLSLNSSKTQVLIRPEDIESRFGFEKMREINDHIEKWDPDGLQVERHKLYKETREASGTLRRRALQMLRNAQDSHFLGDLRTALVKSPALTEKILGVFESATDQGAALDLLMDFIGSDENMWPDQEAQVWRSIRRMEGSLDRRPQLTALAKRRASTGIGEMARSEAVLTVAWFSQSLRDRADMVKFATSGRAKSVRLKKACVLAAGLVRENQLNVAFNWAIRQPNRIIVDFGIFLERYRTEPECAADVLKTINPVAGPFKVGQRLVGIRVEDVLLLGYGARSGEDLVLDQVRDHIELLQKRVTEPRAQELLGELLSITNA